MTADGFVKVYLASSFVLNSFCLGAASGGAHDLLLVGHRGQYLVPGINSRLAIL